MSPPPIQPLVAGNWKMNGLREQLGEIEAIRDAIRCGAAGGAEVLICPPATLIRAAAEIAAGSPLKIGGQDCHTEVKGPHTGDISAAMLKDAGASYVIVGHSERRADHQETNVVVRSKAAAALAAGLQPIVCVGETKADRDAGRAQSVVHRQLAGSLPTAEEAVISVAYEPIWAIGTGITPTADDIAEMHSFLRSEIGRLLPRTADRVRLLYGGSVKASNARELMGVADVNGALVGGASLTAADFLGIAAAYLAPTAVAV